MADEERQATPFMSCFDFGGAEKDDKSNLLAGIKGNEKAGGDKNYKKIVAGHGSQVLGTFYALNFETALRAQAFIKLAELKLEEAAYLEFLEQLSQGEDIIALGKMVLENRTDYTAKALVNPALAGDVATTGEAIPGKWAAYRDPTGQMKAKRAELLAEQKKDAGWAKQEKSFADLKTAGLMTDEEIEAKKAAFYAKDPANDTFDGNLEDTGEEGEKTAAEKVEASTTDAVAEGAAGLVTKGFGAFLKG